ncbi:SMU1112c/YaeR family gloxylase I-like metalloprotein [Thalassotalea profundi]|uniref:VOC family protein n=1 Tax=Thalassotalea profundi TaxID=2036687 RepID=A0ABQ3IR65_9GAMM|nr:VOC family protein [Thalassotalea profundi]GHE88531.1 VOC family protein [Thalassotalea profundi]
MLKGLHHAAIICSDYQKSKHFYLNILQLKVVAEHYREQRNSYKLDLALPDGSQIELFSFTRPPARLSYPEACGLRHLAFVVDSVEETVAYLITQGVDVEPIRIDEYTQKAYTFFSDPDGLPLEIYQK